MTKLTKKDERRLLFATKRLFSIKSSILVPKSISDFPTELSFARELRLEGNRTVFLTDSGYEHFRDVVNIVDRSDYFDGMAGFSDIWVSWKRAVEKWLSNGVEPECSDEVVQAIAELVVQNVDDHTFIVPLFGIGLDSGDSFPLGAMTIMRMSIDVLDSARIEHHHADISHLLELNKNYLWLKGTMRGTKSVAQIKFSEQANLTVGMLAITAASIYEWGQMAFELA